MPDICKSAQVTATIFTDIAGGVVRFHNLPMMTTLEQFTVSMHSSLNLPFSDRTFRMRCLRRCEAKLDSAGHW